MEMTVRDHSKPCEHPDPDGAYWVGTRVAETFLCKWSECPGGREIKLERVEPPLYTDTEIVWYEHSEPNDAIVWVEVTDEMV